LGLPQVPHRGSHLELAGQPLGPAEPPTDLGLTRTAYAVKLSSKLFLLSTDDTLHALASAAFLRMLRQEDMARVPDFAGQRVRQASIVVQVVNGKPSRTLRSTYSILDIKADGFLDVERLNTQQIARLDLRFDRSSAANAVEGGPVIDAAQRFVARGGTWEPDAGLLRRIEAAALGQVSCPRVRVLR
jgi:hypothetical protein